MYHATRRRLAWIAALAMMLNALWPVIAQAKPGPAPTLQEVCTSAGLQKIAVDASAPVDHSSGGKASPHCAFCSFGNDQVALPSARIVAVVHADVAAQPIPIVRVVPLPEPPSRSSAQPRAPPYSS